MKYLVDRENEKIEIVFTKLSDLKTDLFKHILPTYKDIPTREDIDEELWPLLTDMWGNGYKTLACCASHGQGDVGYIIFRPPRCKKWRVIAWKAGIAIPKSLMEMADGSGFNLRPFTVEVKLSKEEIEKIIKHSQ